MTSSGSATASSRGSRRRRASSTSPTASRATTCARARWSCARALPFCPAGVHLVVVDPGVGAHAARRRAARGRGGPHPRRPRQRRAVARGRALRRRRRSRRRGALAAPPRAGLGDVPRARRVRAGRRAPRGRRGARRAGEPIDPDELVQLGCRPPYVEAERVVRPRRQHRHVRQRGARRRRTRRRRPPGCGSATASASTARRATYARTFEDVGAGRADALRGRLPHARAGGQPRLGAASCSTSRPTTRSLIEPA